MGPFFTEVGGVLLETLGDIGGDDALFLDILDAPGDTLALAIQTLSLEAHRSSQGYRAPRIPLAFQQNLWCCHQPTATLGRPHEGNHHTGIALTGFQEEHLGRDGLFQRLISTTGQHYLLERTQI